MELELDLIPRPRKSRLCLVQGRKFTEVGRRKEAMCVKQNLVLPARADGVEGTEGAAR